MLTASLKALFFKVANNNVTINNMLPERIAPATQVAHAAMKRERLRYNEAVARKLNPLLQLERFSL